MTEKETKYGLYHLFFIILLLCNARTPKEKMLIALRKGQSERVSAMIDQFPEELNVNMSADTADNKLLHRAAR